MIQKQLGQKIINIKAASNFEQKLIESIYSIMLLKRKAQEDYKNNLEIINKELQKYIVAQNGFLTQIIKSFQSYIAVMYQNQKILIEGYDSQVLYFLKNAKQSQFQATIVEKVQTVDKKVQECRQKIKQIKKLVKDNEEQLQIISSQVKLKNRMGQLPEAEKKKYAQKYSDIETLKKNNEQTLQQYVDGMMELTMLHNQTLEQVNNYQTFHLQEKANQVFDNFMRTFVLEVSFIRNLQFDVGTILQKVNQRKQQHRKIAIDALRNRMKKQDSKIKRFFLDTYKNWTASSFNINQPYINNRIRQKWERVCQYYNTAL